MTLAVVLCALAAGAYFTKHSRVFELQEIVFYGNRHLSDGQMKKLAGLGGGENLLYMSSREVAEGLMASPWIRDVRIRKEFLHRLLVKVDEAAPAALLRKKGQMFLIDEEGEVLEKLKGRQEHFLPVVSCVRPSKNPQAYREAVYLAKVINETGLSKQRKRVEISGIEGGPQNLSVRLDDLLVKLGKGGYREKLLRLSELADEIGRRAGSVEYVDLRFANRVVVKPVAEVIR
jgi:cell division protein FtsQ